jgi:hypothetical protein
MSGKLLARMKDRWNQLRRIVLKGFDVSGVRPSGSARK